MKKTERIQNIKLDIQTINFDPSVDLLRKVRTELKKLMRVYGNIVGADVSLQLSEPSEQADKIARFRIGVPGQNLFAESVSSTWGQALADATSKLQNQILNRHQAA
jgi:putative sigma-54 modulation protein